MKKVIAFILLLSVSATLFSQNISINTTGAANSTLSMLEVLQISATANAKGIHIAHSGAIAGIGFGLRSEVTGASTTNIAGYFNASGGTNNYPGIFMGGNVGIGIATPLARLHIDGTAETAPVEGYDVTNTNVGNVIRAGTPTNRVFDGGVITFATGGSIGAYIKSGAVSGAQSRLYFGTYKGVNVMTPDLTIINNGNVGVGTTAPTAKFHVNAGDIGVSRIDGGDVTPYARFGLSNGWEQYLANNAFYNSATAQWNFVNGGGYGGLASSMNQISGTINFQTASGGVNPITWNSRMYITNSGNVGIGTTAPAAHLEVRDLTPGANSLTVTKDFNGFGNTNAAFIGGTDGVYGNTGIYVAQKDGLGLNSPTSYIFNVVNNAVSQMLVTGLGDVGIGVTAPAAKLDVQGDVKFRNGAGSLFWSNVASRDFDILQSATSTNRAFSVHSGNVCGSAFGNIAIDFYGNDGAGNNLPGFIMLRNANVGIGTTTPCAKLDVSGNANVSGNLYVTGVVYAGGWGGPAACPSDIRYKKNISPLANSLSGILELQGVNYFLRTNEFPDKFFSEEKQIGFIAQDIEKIFPDLVKTDKDGFKAVDYTRLSPILVEAIKEQQKTIEKLRSDNESLKRSAEERIEKLEAEMKLLIQIVKAEAKK